MANVQVTLELTEQELATIDEIAANLETDRTGALRDMVEVYLAGYSKEKEFFAEAERQADTGETIPHDEVVAWFERWKQDTVGNQEAA